MPMSIPLYEFCFLYNNKKQLVLCWKTNKNLIFIAIVQKLNFFCNYFALFDNYEVD
jgi:hypothetical protein